MPFNLFRKKKEPEQEKPAVPPQETPKQEEAPVQPQEEVKQEPAATFSGAYTGNNCAS